MSPGTLPRAVLKPTSTVGSDTIANPVSGFHKGSAFWLTFIAILVCSFVSALDLTAISIALPTITDSLSGGDKFVWVGSAYGLASAAGLPLSGRLADAFGRRPVMLASVGLFFIGSALSGAAQDMDMLIGARSKLICCPNTHIADVAQRSRESEAEESSTSLRSSYPTSYH